MPQPLTHAIGVVADIAGLQLSAEDHEFLRQPELSGLIFFARNYQSPQQLHELTASIRKLRPDLLLCVDQEGGRVQRFREGFTRLPPMLVLEQIHQRNPQQALALAQELGWLMAAEVRACGVHLSFAPVLDIERDVSQVIGDRAFGHDAATVTRLAGAFIAGMQQAGMAAVGKHFPGHGAVAADSHLALPVDERSMDELETDLRPFAGLIATGQLAGIMPAHVVYPAVDPHYTAGFSAFWLQEILRRQLQFEGVIFSDDLSMAGAASAGDYTGRTQAAAAAGANALLVCNDRSAAQQVVDAVRELRTTGEFTRLSLEYLQGPATAAVDVARQQQIRQQLAALWP